MICSWDHILTTGWAKLLIKLYSRGGKIQRNGGLLLVLHSKDSGRLLPRQNPSEYVTGTGGLSLC